MPGALTEWPVIRFSERLGHAMTGGLNLNRGILRALSCTSQTVNRGCALNATVPNLRTYFQLLHNVQDGDYLTRPQDVYNCDETIIDLNKSSQRVVIPRRMKVSHSR